MTPTVFFPTLMYVILAVNAVILAIILFSYLYTALKETKDEQIKEYYEKYGHLPKKEQK